jgi:predicted nucleic acid-binding protein
MIGLDTCAVIDLLKGDEKLILLMNSLDEEFCLCQASYLELTFGINPKIKSHLEEEEFYDNLFGELKVIGIDNEFLKNASRLFWKMKSSGYEIGKMDSIIASSFMSAGVNRVVTRDKHFCKVRGLNVLNY